MKEPSDRDPATPRPNPKPDREAERRHREAVREQATTEVEERPYLDTEGGE